MIAGFKLFNMHGRDALIMPMQVDKQHIGPLMVTGVAAWAPHNFFNKILRRLIDTEGLYYFSYRYNYDVCRRAILTGGISEPAGALAALFHLKNEGHFINCTLSP